MIDIYKFKGAGEGIKLAVMGGVHGNEVCGTLAIKKLINEIENNEVTLAKGALVLIPVANPQAHELGKRFIEENLNRVFLQTENPKSYEQCLANSIIPHLLECDALLDLHSIHSRGFPFAMHFGFYSEEEEAFIASLSLPYVIEGWEEAYAASFPNLNRGQSSHTAAFMHSIGKIAAGVECGFHQDAAAVDVAYNTIILALKHFGLIEGRIPMLQKPRRILMEQVFLRIDKEDRFAQDFTHGQKLKKGEVVFIKKDGNPFTLEKDAVILFPRPDCPLGEEWFYIAAGDLK